MRTSVTALFLFTAAAVASDDYFASPDVHPGDAGGFVSGAVFDDVDRDGVRDAGEEGVPGVLVSNGLDWAATGDDGGYRIAVRDNMNLTIVQPSGWRVPTDERRLPQFFHVHKPGGSPAPLRFGGLPDTGPAPAIVVLVIDFTRLWKVGHNRGLDRPHKRFKEWCRECSRRPVAVGHLRGGRRVRRVHEDARAAVPVAAPRRGDEPLPADLGRGVRPVVQHHQVVVLGGLVDRVVPVVAGRRDEPRPAVARRLRGGGGRRRRR